MSGKKDEEIPSREQKGLKWRGETDWILVDSLEG